MPTVADELAAVPALRGVPAAALRGSAPLWEAVTLAPGEVLWDSAAPVRDLAVVLSGELVAELDGVPVGRGLPGEVVGEAAAFFAGAPRTATLRAGAPTRVLRLPVASLRTLRWQQSPVYDALLDLGLRALVRRIAAAGAAIVRTAAGDVPAPTRAAPSTLVRLWRALRPGGPTGPCPPLEPLLRGLPGLSDADGATLAALAAAFRPEPVEEGRILFLEGDPGAAAWLVAEGRIDVLRAVRGDRAERLATLGPGALLGVNTLVVPGPRTASCVAATPGWVYRLDAETHDRVERPNRVAWRECLLAVLAAQLRNANALIRDAAGGPAPAPRPTPPPSDERLDELVRASGWLEAVPEPLDAPALVLAGDADHIQARTNA